MHFLFAFEFLRFYFGDKAAAAWIYEATKDDSVASEMKQNGKFI